MSLLLKTGVGDYGIVKTAQGGRVGKLKKPRLLEGGVELGGGDHSRVRLLENNTKSP